MNKSNCYIEKEGLSLKTISKYLSSLTIRDGFISGWVILFSKSIFILIAFVPNS